MSDGYFFPVITGRVLLTLDVVGCGDAADDLLSPSQAREIAAALLVAAERADASSQ